MITKKDIVTTKKPKRLKNGAVINRFSHVVAGAYIGNDVMIGERCYVACGAMIGDGSRVQNGVDVWDGVHIGKDVFIGPSVRFTNHHRPEIVRRNNFKPDTTIVGDNAIICAATVIVAPCIINVNAFVGAASLVLRNVECFEEVKGVVK